MLAEREAEMSKLVSESRQRKRLLLRESRHVITFSFFRSYLLGPKKLNFYQ